MFAGLPYFGHGGSNGYTYNGAFRVHVHREPGFWSKEAVLDLRMLTGIFPSGYRPADRNTYTPVGWGAVAGIERAMDVESLTDADALLALQRIYDVRSDYGWARDDLELTDLQWCWCEERKFAAGVGFVLRETMRSYFCEEVPTELLSAALVAQPAPPPPVLAAAPAPAPDLRPHDLRKIKSGKYDGYWQCIACMRKAQRRTLVKGLCAGAKDTAKAARLQARGFEPQKKKKKRAL